MKMNKILIVDDEAEIRENISSYFKMKGYQAVAVESGALGLTLLGVDSFDVLISDLKMPGMDGIEFSDRARKLCPGLVIVVLTGYGSLETAQSAIRIGVQDYITKPLDLNKLLASVEDGIARMEEQKKGTDYSIALKKEMDEEREKFEAMKDEFIVLINHELRTPVSTLSAGLSLFHDVSDVSNADMAGKLSGRQKEALMETIETSRRRLVNVIEDITYYMDLVKGQIEPDRKRVVLTDFFNDNFNGLEHLISGFEAALKYEFPDERLTVNVDREKLLNVISRLVHNAACHNPKGGKIRIRISSSNAAAANGSKKGYVIIEVIDNGKGIKKEAVENLFASFNVSDISHHHRGIGLGMAISRKIIELNGGTIRLDSVEGKGTTVTIELPASA